MRSCERYTSPFQATARCRSRVAKPQRLCAHFFKSALGSILEKVDRYITFARAKIRKNFGKANSFVPPVSFCLPDARLLIRRSAAGGMVARRYPPAGEKWRRRNAARKSCSHKKKRCAAANNSFLFLRIPQRCHSRVAKPQRLCAYQSISPWNRRSKKSC